MCCAIATSCCRFLVAAAAARCIGRWTGIARALAAALVLAVSVGAASAEETVRITLTSAQWQDDIRVFGQEMERRHRSAFHLTTKPRFEREVADLIARAPALED